MKVQLEESRMDLTDLRILAASNKEVQVRTESPLQARLVTLQTELAHIKAGQVDLLCLGEQGSKWVLGRLVEGQQEERSLVWKELSLPQHLTKHIANSNCRKVILVLAEVDSQARKELLKQTKMEIDTILDMEGGQEFVTKLVKGE